MLLYRLLLSVFALFVLTGLILRRDRVALRARLGRIAPDDRRPHLWLHGASNGELASARPLIDMLRTARPDLGLLVTTNTKTGVELVDGWNLRGVVAHLAPLDVRWANRRVQSRWHVQGHITLESELWPNRLIQTARRGPVIVAGGRLTERTARLWTTLQGAARPALGSISHLSPQDTGCAERFAKLGLPQARIGPVLNLKSLYAPDPELIPDAALVAAFPRDKTWAAASTHAPEEEIVIAAHKQALMDTPDLRLILAPRHPKRGDEVARLLTEAGLAFARRSHGDAPGAPVLLADTMGEMPLWYALSGRVFVGGSLSNRGGHTPYEPAHFGCALLHGPDTRNFGDAYAVLMASSATRLITDAASLASALKDLKQPETQTRLGAAAHAALPSADGLQGLGQRILHLLP